MLRLDLPDNARRTFRFHLAYAMLDGAVGGIVLMAPIMAIKALHCPSWQLQIREVYGGIGMLVTLYLGGLMATHRKMPFVVVPGVLAALNTLAMAFTMGNSFWFLTFYGIGAMFEITTRPAITAILRLNYPVEQRGHATAVVRTWSSLSFMVTILLSATLLHLAKEHVLPVARAQIAASAFLGLAAYLCFRQIAVQEEPLQRGSGFRLHVLKNIRDVLGVVAHDARYRRYLLSCFADFFFSLLYLPLIWKLLSNLEYGYIGCAAMVHALPAAIAFLTTGFLGPWLDRTNPWISWAWMRFLSAGDAMLLAITPWAVGFAPGLVFVLPITGRILRGSVQGGWWVLCWQLGITHFAPPGADTSRYMGIMVFLSGATRILGSLASMLLLWAFQARLEPCFYIGAAGILLSGIYSLSQAAREKRECHPQTFAQFESQFDVR
jgi:hypothetical protein